jgi:hypothetical protein
MEFGLHDVLDPGKFSYLPESTAGHLCRFAGIVWRFRELWLYCCPHIGTAAHRKRHFVVEQS